MSSRSFRWPAIVTLLLVALVPRSATAQVFQDRLVQAPSLSAPERGSVAGTLAGLSFDPGGLSQGGFALPLPVSAPADRGPLLASVFPSYSPDRGISEWGMGWGAALSIRRVRVVGVPSRQISIRHLARRHISCERARGYCYRQQCAYHPN